MTSAPAPRAARRNDRASNGRTANVQVWVELAGAPTLAGRLFAHRRGRTGSASFTYDPGWVSNDAAYALDPALPRVSGTLQTPTHQKLFGAFADSCPDRWGRRLIERTERDRASATSRTPVSFGELDLLLRVRDDLRQGSIRFRRDEEFLEHASLGVPTLTDLPALLSAADNVADDDSDDDPQSLALLLRQGSSLGGARPKAHVRDTDGRIAIAKFPSPTDEWNVMAWEKTALDLATAAGIVVSDNQLVTIGGRNVLIVDRFDRLRDGRRRGYQSAMTALERTDGQHSSYLEIAELIETRSRAANAELEQLFRRVSFNILISNTDDHLHNHGFLHQHADIWELSPAFDVNPDPQPGERHLSTAIDRDTLADVDNLLATALLYRLSETDALGVLRQVRDAVSTWEAVAARNGLTKSACVAMASAFDNPAAIRTSELLA
jgi:serine/threonine-protein kinase HipA